MLELQNELGKEKVGALVIAAARRSLDNETSFRQELLADAARAPLLEDRLDELLDPAGYLGVSEQQVDSTIA